MSQFELVFLYCLLCLAIAAGLLHALKTTWVYLVVSSLLPPMLVLGIDSLWRGGVSVWADIVFVMLLLIAIGVALLVLAASAAIRRRGRSGGI